MNKTASAFARYRILPLVVVGLLLLTVFDGLMLLLWSLAAFQFKLDVASAAFLPTLIYLLGIFISCLLMTMLIRGGTVFPSVAVALIAAVVSLFYADVLRLTVGGILLRLILSLLAGAIGFTVGKLYAIRQRRQRAAQRQSVPSKSEPVRQQTEATAAASGVTEEAERKRPLKPVHPVSRVRREVLRQNAEAAESPTRNNGLVEPK